MRETQWGYLLVYHLLYSRSGQYANPSPIELGKEKVGLLIPDPQPLKKKVHDQRGRVGTTHGSTAVQLLSGAKGAIVKSAPLSSGWPELRKVAEEGGGGYEKPNLCCYFSSPSQPETVKTRTSPQGLAEGAWLNI